MAAQETTRLFQDMINDYLPNDLLMTEMSDHVYVLNKVEMVNDWVGQGDLIVPFEGATASSLRYGALTDQDDIADDKFIRGKVTKQKEIWGSMQFHSRDLMEHGKVSARNFLQILPGRIDRFIKLKRNAVSTNLLIGAHVCKASAASNSSAGVVKVDRPDRLQINQKLQYHPSDASDVTAYVKTINMNTREITLVTARGGSTAVDLSAGGKDIEINAKFYNEDAEDNAFASFRELLLSAANGGSSTIYGQTKTAYPYLQAINVDGGEDGLGVTAENIVDCLFDAGIEIAKFGKGNPTDIILSLDKWAAVVKVLQNAKTSYNVVPGSMKTSEFGWKEIKIGGHKGEFNVVGVHEADDDVAYFIDWRAFSFHTNGGFRKEMSPDGLEYYTVRSTSGYKYIIDLCLFGELVCKIPSYCGVLYGINF